MNRERPQLIAGMRGFFTAPASADQMVSEIEQMYARHFTATEPDKTVEPFAVEITINT